MDLIGVGCTALRAQFFEPFMRVAGYFGHGGVGSVVALSLITHGYLYKNTRTKRAGLALIIVLILAGITADALKELVHLPRPRLRTSFGFPSGHASAAFGSAAVLGIAFPSASPLFYLLAILTGFSRLYFRAHFTWDVIAGAMVGLAAGLPIASKLIGRGLPASRSPLRLLAWLFTSMVGVGVLLFFYTLERAIETSMSLIDNTESASLVTLDFGTPQARKALRDGWFEDELWDDGKRSLVWSGGPISQLAIELPSARDYRFRITLLPYSHKGPACQRVEVKLNEKFVAKMVLEKGWHSYEFSVPGKFVTPGNNLLEFFYDYADSLNSLGRGSDNRRLSVAFDKLSIF